MRSNYIEILEKPVEIPIIQRDYAQGRTDSKTNKIRKDFLNAIFDFLQQKKANHTAELELDFLYGLNKESGTFIPIDGQQRLTALWLLYLFTAKKEKIEATETEFLKNFLYETRHSTTQFCKNLTAFEPAFINSSISQEIKNQSWYFETWNYDPGVQAMLVVLDDIENRYSDFDDCNLWNLIGNDSCPFYFYKLDMDKVGLTDDLYIKMNSRGKALTEFEYFKAGFTEILEDPFRRTKFETSIDGIWMDTIWQIVFESKEEEQDIASAVDDAFLNLFNFISSVLSFKQNVKTTEEEYYQDTESTPELLKVIYSTTENQDYLYDTLDAICVNYQTNPQFWNDTFYYGKDNYGKHKTRIYFPHGNPNLLNRCLFHFSDFRGFSFPEQILLLACLTHFRKEDPEFTSNIRILRNLVVNSENELRETNLGKSFIEAEQFVNEGTLSIFSAFKTDQIEEEKIKEENLINGIIDSKQLNRLEDSDLFRGSVSIMPLDSRFNNRSSKFLELFEEDEIIENYAEGCDLLLAFGDYSQTEGDLTNLMAKNKRDIRFFLTSPGYNKINLYNNTRPVVLECLDFFINNPHITPGQKIHEIKKSYTSKPKDWIYYFLHYPSFRKDCQYGYYYWGDESEYVIWKMGKRQFNGYHWNPFLHEVLISNKSSKLTMGNYGWNDKMIITKGRTKVSVCAMLDGRGFLLENGNNTVDHNPVLNNLLENGFINENFQLLIDQNNEGYDLEDRIGKLKLLLNQIID